MMRPETPLALALALTLAGCGFATEPDPGYGDPPDAGAGGAGGAGGQGGEGGNPGQLDAGAVVDQYLPPPLDAGLDAAPEPDGALPDQSVRPDSGPADMAPPVPDDGPLDLGPADLGPADLGPADLGPLDLGPDDLGPDDLGASDLGASDLGPDATIPLPDMGAIDPPGPADPRCVDACAALGECDLPAGPDCIAECDTEPGPARELLARCTRDHVVARCDLFGFIECADRDPTDDDRCAYACATLAVCDLDPDCVESCAIALDAYPADCVEDHLDRDRCDVVAYDDCRIAPDP